jgi:predicted metalloprotease with PDZ domain
LAEIADKFVRVRLTKIAGLNLRVFEFDYDLTWFVFFLNADETVYGRYGGRDAQSAEGRLSLNGLHYAMTHALESHKNPPPKRPTDPPVRAEDYPAAKKHRGCIHCHNVSEFRRANAQAAGTWSRSDLWVYPLPENIGLTFEIDHGNQVKSVRPGSPADQAGLKPGDIVKLLNGISIASLADASQALHQAPAKGEISITWMRQERKYTTQLKLTEGWRKTDLTWRPSLIDLLPNPPFRGQDLSADDKKQLGLPLTRAAFRQADTVHSSLEAIGLRPHDIVIGFDGQAITGTKNDLLAYLRNNYLVGDSVTVNVIRGNQLLELRLVLK